MAEGSPVARNLPPMPLVLFLAISEERLVLINITKDILSPERMTAEYEFVTFSLTVNSRRRGNVAFCLQVPRTPKLFVGLKSHSQT